MDKKYANACKEVIVLFDYFLAENDLAKIPEEQLEYIKQNANQDYIYCVDENKALEEQEISQEAKAIILSLYKKYFTTAEQKKKVDEILYLYRQKNIRKSDNVNYNIFGENSEVKVSLENSIESKKNEETSYALIETQSLWKKITNKIFRIFRRR